MHASCEVFEIGVEVFFIDDNIWTMDGDGEPLQRKAERKTALSNWRKSKRFPRYIGKRMRTMLISLKTPIFLPICTGSYR